MYLYNKKQRIRNWSNWTHCRISSRNINSSKILSILTFHLLTFRTPTPHCLLSWSSNIKMIRFNIIFTCMTRSQVRSPTTALFSHSICHACGMYCTTTGTVVTLLSGSMLFERKLKPPHPHSGPALFPNSCWLCLLQLDNQFILMSLCMAHRLPFVLFLCFQIIKPT